MIKDNQIETVKVKPKARKKLKTAAVILLILTGLYCVAMFTNIPIIKKYRDLYIETAMMTMNHKWLATFFIPKSVIDEVEANQAAFIAMQQGYHSSWDSNSTQVADYGAVTDEKKFLKVFSEIDASTFDAYISKHPDALKNGYEKLLINKAGLKDSGTSIKTRNGDQVLAIDVENSIMIIKVTGNGFVGKMALIKDPAKVRVGVASSIGSSGQTVDQIADDNNAILAVNASGFADYKATGNGGEVVGLLIADGKKINDPIKEGYLNIGFDRNNHLFIGALTDQVKYRDAVEFIPAMIINGRNLINDPDKSGFFGIQPRTAIGQTTDGTVLLLTIDGRKVGYSTGATIGDCESIMQQYGAVQAANLDGGSSTVMVYRGQEITRPADSTHYGRLVPDAIIVEYTGAHEAPKPSGNQTSHQNTQTNPTPTPASPSPSDQASPSPSDQASPSPSDQASPSPSDQASPSPSAQTPPPSPTTPSQPSP